MDSKTQEVAARVARAIGDSRIKPSGLRLDDIFNDFTSTLTKIIASAIEEVAGPLREVCDAHVRVAQGMAKEYRERAEKAERELAEWRRNGVSAPEEARD